jgi:hypothetical protein
MDKKDFRRLYKELYLSAQTGPTAPVVITDHDLDKISDRVFKAFDAEGSGTVTIFHQSHLNFLFFRQIDIRR